MQQDNDESREYLNKLIEGSPGQWFDVCYRLRWIDGKLEFIDLSAIPVSEATDRASE